MRQQLTTAPPCPGTRYSADWHLAEEHLEQSLLTTFINRRRLYAGSDPETMRRLLLQEQPATAAVSA